MSKHKPRLGRGLSSLLSVSEVDPPAPAVDVGAEAALPLATPALPVTGQLFHVELSHLRVNPHQPRRTFNAAEVEGLADSLRQSGLIQPIVVRQTADGYELIAGERRVRAAKLAGLTRLPAILRRADGAEQAELALVENIHRANLNPIERALAYRSLTGQLGLTQEELATRLGEDRSTVANHLRLLDLGEPTRQRVAAGDLSLGHAKVLAGVHDLPEQQRLGELAVAQQLSVRSLEHLVQTSKVTPALAPKPSSAHIPDLEKRLSRDLQMRVQVRQSGRPGRGRLVIHYATLDQFDDLLVRLKIHADE